MIRFENIRKVYGRDNIVLDGIDIEIKKGEFVFLVGFSGSGKSTFLKLLLKEEEPTSGKLFLDGNEISHVSRRKIPDVRRKMGVVFQDFRLLKNKNVFDNVAFAMEIFGEKSMVIRREVPKILSLMGIAPKARSYPDELSGGEQQRVAIARAMVNNPPLLIADEPTGNLDYKTAEDIMQLLERINRRGTTILMATHDRNIVNRMNKRVITLEGGKIYSDVKGGYNVAL